MLHLEFYYGFWIKVKNIFETGPKYSLLLFMVEMNRSTIYRIENCAHQ